MTSMIEQTEHVLAVPDLARSVRWWREAMGFQTVFETPGWVFMALGSARLRLGECPDALPAHALGDHSYFAFFHVTDIDALAEHLRVKGATIRSGPADQPWGLREMAVESPDGHRFMLGQPV